MNKIIIFGNCLQNTVGLVRSMGETGHRVDLLIEPCRRSDCFIKHSRYVNKIHWLRRLEDAPDVLLREYAGEKEKPVIFCGSDPTISLLDRNYDRLHPHFLFFNAGKQGRINHFLDKMNTFELAKKCGLRIINTKIISDMHDIPCGIAYPCFIKGASSVKSTKADIHICNSEEELKQSLREGVEYLAQEYIERDYELNLIGLAYNNGQNICAPCVVRKIRDTVKRQSAFFRLDDVKEHPLIDLSKIGKFVKEIGYEGIFSVEFLYKKGELYFLEINLRNDACGYIYTAAGANYPLLWYKYATGALTPADTAGLRLRTPFYLMHENDMYNIVEGKVSVWQWMRDFHRSGAFFVMNRRDPLPFVCSCAIHARQLGKKVLRKLGIPVR